MVYAVYTHIFWCLYHPKNDDDWRMVYYCFTNIYLVYNFQWNHNITIYYNMQICIYKKIYIYTFIQNKDWIVYIEEDSRSIQWKYQDTAFLTIWCNMIEHDIAYALRIFKIWFNVSFNLMIWGFNGAWFWGCSRI